MIFLIYFYLFLLLKIETMKICQVKLKSKEKADSLTSTLLPVTAAVLKDNEKRKMNDKHNLPVLKKRIIRDFFGRPVPLIEGDDVPPTTMTNGNNKMPGAGKISSSQIWYVHNDGVSNAVRRSVKVSNFF